MIRYRKSHNPGAVKREKCKMSDMFDGRYGQIWLIRNNAILINNNGRSGRERQPCQTILTQAAKTLGHMIDIDATANASPVTFPATPGRLRMRNHRSVVKRA